MALELGMHSVGGGGRFAAAKAVVCGIIVGQPVARLLGPVNGRDDSTGL
jgi:hypothetical protein